MPSFKACVCAPLAQRPMHVEGLYAPVACRYTMGAESAGVLHLLDEVLAAAVERCLEPILLESHTLDRLTSAALHPA